MASHESIQSYIQVRCFIYSYISYYNLNTNRIVERNDNYLLKEKFGEGIPDVKILANNIALLLVNQHFSITGSRPLPPQVVEIGGVHIKDEKPLPSVRFHLRTN